MRLNFNKEIEFFFKQIFISKKKLFEKRINRSIKNKDEIEIELIKELTKPGSDTIDVGVYRGVYSYEMSLYCKTVHSFEPNPVIFEDLEKNLPKIIKNIKLYNLALSDKNDQVDLKIPIRNPEFNKKNYEEYYRMGLATIHNNKTFENFKKFKVYTKMLDDFNFNNHISFIKIDVEGHELEVLKGAKKTIKKFKPNMLIEIEERHSNKKVQTTIDYICSLGYKSFVYDQKKLVQTSLINNLEKFNNFIFKPI